MKNEIPPYPFISFMIKKTRYNGYIVKANRKGYTVKYFANNPVASNFYNAPNICTVSKNKILEFQG